MTGTDAVVYNDDDRPTPPSSPRAISSSSPLPPPPPPSSSSPPPPPSLPRRPQYTFNSDGCIIVRPINQQGLQDEWYWIHWRVYHPGEKPNQRFIRWRHLVPQKQLNEWRQTELQNRKQSHSWFTEVEEEKVEENKVEEETEVMKRIRYWIQKDIETCWCLSCEQERDITVSERFHDYQMIQRHVAKNYHLMNLLDLIESLQNMYETLIVPMVHRSNIARYDEYMEKKQKGKRNIVFEWPVDEDWPGGPQPRPPFYWSKETIYKHYTQHITDPAYIAEDRARDQKALIDIYRDNHIYKNEMTGQLTINKEMYRALTEMWKLQKSEELRLEPRRAGRRAEEAQIGAEQMKADRGY
jgi:hypothetical protein